MSKKSKASTPLLTDAKYNYQSSDNGGNSTSVAGVGYEQFSDGNLSEHQNRNKNVQYLHSISPSSLTHLTPQKNTKSTAKIPR